MNARHGKVNARRAKKILIIIAVTAVVGTSLNTMARLYKYDQFRRLYQSCVPLVCISIMTTCYILMAVALLLRARASRNQIAVLQGTYNQPSEPGSSHIFTKAKSRQPNVGFSNMTSKMKKKKSVENAECVVDLGSSNVTMNV